MASQQLGQRTDLPTTVVTVAVVVPQAARPMQRSAYGSCRVGGWGESSPIAIAIAKKDLNNLCQGENHAPYCINIYSGSRSTPTSQTRREPCPSLQPQPAGAGENTAQHCSGSCSSLASWAGWRVLSTATPQPLPSLPHNRWAHVAHIGDSLSAPASGDQGRIVFLIYLGH